MQTMMIAFTLFHIVVGTASLGLAVRLLTPWERAHWRSPAALLVAELLCWVYPVIAFAAAHSAWQAWDEGARHAFPLLLTPIVWLIVMGTIFAVVDFAEDGVLGNTRAETPES